MEADRPLLKNFLSLSLGWIIGEVLMAESDQIGSEVGDARECGQVKRTLRKGFNSVTQNCHTAFVGFPQA